MKCRGRNIFAYVEKIKHVTVSLKIAHSIHVLQTYSISTVGFVQLAAEVIFRFLLFARFVCHPINVPVRL